MESLAVLILAAGQGKRMGLTSGPKVLAATTENHLIIHVLQAVQPLAAERIVLVTGHKREEVEQKVKSWLPLSRLKPNLLRFALQPEQKGTGDAVRCALPELKNFIGTVLILYGDVPLIQSQTLLELLRHHRESKATISLLSLITDEANTYGRILRDQSGKFVSRIVEARDCTEAEAQIREFNVGVYALEAAFLKPAVDSLTNNNAQGEYYLTDIVTKANSEGQTVVPVTVKDAAEVQGVNDLWDLTMVNTILNERRLKELVTSGVQLLDPASVLVDAEVEIAPGARIGPQVQLQGKTKIARDVVIEGACLLIDTIVEEGAKIKFGVRAEGARIGARAMVGPFAHLREGTVLGEEVKVGNFVETKKASLSKGAKASHLTYLGDCKIGEDSNIGAGTITCNFDGFKKHETIIGKGVFIGSNSVLIAPVTIEDNAYVGAGSAITKRVEKDSLAFTRAALVSKAGWAKRHKERNKK